VIVGSLSLGRQGSSFGQLRHDDGSGTCQGLEPLDYTLCSHGDALSNAEPNLMQVWRLVASTFTSLSFVVHHYLSSDFVVLIVTFISRVFTVLHFPPHRHAQVL